VNSALDDFFKYKEQRFSGKRIGICLNQSSTVTGWW